MDRIKQARCVFVVVGLSVILAAGAAQPPSRGSPTAATTFNALDDVASGQQDIVQDPPLYADTHLAERYRARPNFLPRSQQRSNSKRASDAAGHAVVSWTSGQSLRIFAQMVKPPGVTLPQTMASLYLANPQAFEHGDPKRLKEGVKLTVPTAQAMRALSPERAESLLGLNASQLAPDTSAADSGPSELTQQQALPTRLRSNQNNTANLRAGASPSLESAAASAPADAKLNALEHALLEREAALAAAQTRIQTLEARIGALQQQKALGAMSHQLLAITALIAAVVGVGALLGLLFILMNKRKAKAPTHQNNPPAFDESGASAITLSEEELAHGVEAAKVLHQSEAPLGMLGPQGDIELPIDILNASESNDNVVFNPAAAPPMLEEESVVPAPLDNKVVLDQPPPVASMLSGPELAEDSLSAKGGDFLLDFDFTLEPVNKSPRPLSQTLPAAANSASKNEVNTADVGLEFAADAPSLNSDPLVAKLDLARVYLDMGDKQGAREVLQALLVTEPSPELKRQAEQMLAYLG